jgi:predicted nucleic acid-binding protein
LDESDNFLIELALAGNATHIITNNIRDLITTDLRFPNMAIVTPETFLRDE